MIKHTVQHYACSSRWMKWKNVWRSVIIVIITWHCWDVHIYIVNLTHAMYRVETSIQWLQYKLGHKRISRHYNLIVYSLSSKYETICTLYSQLTGLKSCGRKLFSSLFFGWIFVGDCKYLFDCYVTAWRRHWHCRSSIRPSFSCSFPGNFICAVYLLALGTMATLEGTGWMRCHLQVVTFTFSAKTLDTLGLQSVWHNYLFLKAQLFRYKTKLTTSRDGEPRHAITKMTWSIHLLSLPRFPKYVFSITIN